MWECLCVCAQFCKYKCVSMFVHVGVISCLCMCVCVCLCPHNCVHVCVCQAYNYLYSYPSGETFVLCVYWHQPGRVLGLLSSVMDLCFCNSATVDSLD